MEWLKNKLGKSEGPQLYLCPYIQLFEWSLYWQSWETLINIETLMLESSIQKKPYFLSNLHNKLFRIIFWDNIAKNTTRITVLLFKLEIYLKEEYIY